MRTIKSRGETTLMICASTLPNRTDGVSVVPNLRNQFPRILTGSPGRAVSGPISQTSGRGSGTVTAFVLELLFVGPSSLSNSDTSAFNVKEPACGN
jgi:hypothetical protein